MTDGNKSKLPMRSFFIPPTLIISVTDGSSVGRTVGYFHLSPTVQRSSLGVVVTYILT